MIFFTMTSFNSFGQKIKYVDYKNDLSLDNYKETIENEKYSPNVAAFCNYLFPTSGYFYVGEPMRGVLVLSGQMVSSSLIVIGLNISLGSLYKKENSLISGRILIISGTIATGIIQIWSIQDVIKVAKIKNIAYQKNKLSMDLKPDVFLQSNSEKYSAVYGLKLSINF